MVNLAPAFDPILEGFKAGMEEAGYVEDQMDLVLSFGTLATLRAKEGLDGTDIPNIFGPVTDPMASSIVAEVLKPGGKITGIQTGNLTPKRLDWLLRFVPTIKRISAFHNPNDNSSIQGLAALKENSSPIQC